jgi:cbb3-type cytochrome oxidase subunit 3
VALASSARAFGVLGLKMIGLIGFWWACRDQSRSAEKVAKVGKFPIDDL